MVLSPARTPLLALCGALALAALAVPAPARAAGKMVEFAVDACAKFSCRELTKEETAKFGRVLSKLMSLLPTPDAARYEQRGLRASNGVGWTMVSDEMWQAATFPTNVVDNMALGFGKEGVFPRSFALTYSYSLKEEGERQKLGVATSEHVLENGDTEYFDIRIEVSAWPFPAPLEPGMKAAGGSFQKALFGLEKGTSKLAVVVGGSAPKKGTPSGTPGENLAPIKAVRVLFQGPTSEIKALSQKLDRAGLKAMLGPIDKVIGLK